MASEDQGQYKVKYKCNEQAVLFTCIKCVFFIFPYLFYLFYFARCSFEIMYHFIDAKCSLIRNLTQKQKNIAQIQNMNNYCSHIFVRHISFSELLSDLSPKLNIMRKYLVDVFMKSKYKSFDRKFEEITDFVAIKTNCPVKSRRQLVLELRNFKQQLLKKWELHNRHRDRFLTIEREWLEGSCQFTQHVVSKTGRPNLNFFESSESSKRRKTSTIRIEQNADELIYAAQMNLRAEGRTTEAQVIKKISESTTYAKDCLDLSHVAKVKKLSPQEALSLIIEAQLSRKQYDTIRNYANNIFPSYKLVQAEKKRCYPQNIDINESQAIVPLQSLLDHTATRLIQSQENVIQPHSTSTFEKLVLYSKWGFDGSSSHTQYKQKFISETADDKYMFLSSLVPLRLSYKNDNNSVILWQNPKPSSPRFCRPISLQYLKETDELVKVTKLEIDNQIQNLSHTEVNVKGKAYLVEHQPVFTMVDGKLCNTLSNTKSTLKCYLCDATSTEFNNLNQILQKPLKTEYISFGLSVLHCWIRMFESLLHLSYKLPIQAWRVNKITKGIVEQNKKRIQTEFKKQLSLIVDRPKPGFGNSNDGNSARTFFQNFEKSAEITQLDLQLIKRFYIILQTISSGFKINNVKFHTFCQDTASRYVNLYPWMPMTPTVHKILIHGPAIINHALLPIGQLSEEAQESRNKDFKAYRERFSRKTSRTENLIDIMNRLLISSDPIISQMRKLPNTKRKAFDPEVIEMLEEE